MLFFKMWSISFFIKLHPQRLLIPAKLRKMRLTPLKLLQCTYKSLDLATIFVYFLSRILPTLKDQKAVKKKFLLTIVGGLLWYRLHMVCVYSTYINPQTQEYTQLKTICEQSRTRTWIDYITRMSLSNQLVANLLPHIDFTSKSEYIKPKITTSMSVRFRKNYSMSFLLKPTSTRVYQTIWSCRISCFYRLVSPSYSKVHIKKYKKFLDILATKIFMNFKGHKPVANISVVTPDVLDVIPLRVFNTYNSSESQLESHSGKYFSGSGHIKLHRDFFRSLKIRRSLPRRIRRKVLSKKVGRLWLG